VASQSTLEMHLDDVPWQPVEHVLAGGEGEKLSGLMAYMLREDPKTGASAALFKFPPGWSTPNALPESHSVTQEVVLLEGDLIFGGIDLRPGSYLLLLPHTAHGPASTRCGCITFATWDGPLDLTFHNDLKHGDVAPHSE
jgi:hypothetical protein